MPTAEHVFQRQRPGVAQLSATTKIAPIPITDQRHDQSPLEAKTFETFPTSSRHES
jgi:hypothetical protein